MTTGEDKELRNEPNYWTKRDIICCCPVSSSRHNTDGPRLRSEKWNN